MADIILISSILLPKFLNEPHPTTRYLFFIKMTLPLTFRPRSKTVWPTLTNIRNRSRTTWACNKLAKRPILSWYPIPVHNRRKDDKRTNNWLNHECKECMPPMIKPPIWNIMTLQLQSRRAKFLLKRRNWVVGSIVGYIMSVNKTLKGVDRCKHGHHQPLFYTCFQFRIIHLEIIHYT